MFESAVNKLTAWYVAALLVLVVLFSLPIYTVATDRLERSAQRQTEIIEGSRQGPRPDMIIMDNWREQRREVLEQERMQLLRQIAFIDIFIVAIGALASYFFAKRTLMPIEEAHIAQSRFTADASHELRTPLATMQAEIEVALKDTHATKQSLSDTLTSNLEEIARLKNLSDQLLLLTKIDNDELLKTRVALSKVITKRTDELAKRYAVAIEKDITPKIYVNGDDHLLSEVLTILIDNAVRYANKEAPKISVVLKKEHNHAVLTVEDNGQGIANNDLPYIFDRFYRGTKTSGDGHGLGLALAKEIIEKHGGNIAAENIKNSGAKFTIVLHA
jgi:signal transduction histidine kinase